ncbi:MAG: bacillithiol biosynthesis BshC [Chitinophagaceae bacterium]|nr:MAG: bacillithiol biosynthesis BshC [Chitinophagaceae bacterium]
MDCNSTRISYGSSGYFSKIIVDYLEQSKNLSGFYEHALNMDGMAASIKARQNFSTDRKLLVKVLQEQYKAVETSPIVSANINALSSDNTFTICTAHQPVIFTGTLYFIYKILHVVRLARDCEKQFKGKRFIPVFYMGSEDADLDELGKIYMGTQKITWDTRQKGAVGRMNTKGLLMIRFCPLNSSFSFTSHLPSRLRRSFTSWLKRMFTPSVFFRESKRQRVNEPKLTSVPRSIFVAATGFLSRPSITNGIHSFITSGLVENCMPLNR